MLGTVFRRQNSRVTRGVHLRAAQKNGFVHSVLQGSSFVFEEPGFPEDKIVGMPAAHAAGKSASSLKNGHFMLSIVEICMD